MSLVQGAGSPAKENTVIALTLFCSAIYGSIVLSNRRNKEETSRSNSKSQQTKSSSTTPPPSISSYVFDGEPNVTDVEDLSSSGTCSSNTNTTKTKRELPDYNTPIEVSNIKLSKIKKFRRKDLDGKSLIDQTLNEMKTDAQFQETAKRMKEVGAKRMSMDERKLRRRSLAALNVPDFDEFVRQKYAEEYPDRKNSVPAAIIPRRTTKVLQLNIGLYCNQACGHCHVESSPKRKEMMLSKVASKCVDILRLSPEVTTLDLTGGAPELNSSFRRIVREARGARPDIDIIDRCNLTVVHEPGQEDLVEFLRENRVHIVASLPCYSAKNVNSQRGSGVFERSISALLMLNEAGFGQSASDLKLDLVYNPLGAFLPPPQQKLQIQYKKELEENFGIVFNELYTMTNMPIKRFADFLHKRGELEAYMDLLVRNFNFDTTNNLMCVDTVSVGYDGKIFDCDFNQQLGMGVGSTELHEGGKTVFDITKLSDLQKDKIQHDNHCFGCTAGMGSS